MYLGLFRVHFVPGHIICSLTGPTWYCLLCTHRSEIMLNRWCLNIEVNKDAVCVVVMPKIGLVYIPGMPSKEAVLAGIYRKCGNSTSLNVNKSIHSHFRTTKWVKTEFAYLYASFEKNVSDNFSCIKYADTQLICSSAQHTFIMRNKKICLNNLWYPKVLKYWDT